MSGAQERELFPGADDGSVGDQRLGAGVLGGDVATVDRGAQGDGSVGLRHGGEGFPRSDRGAVGDQRRGAGLIGADEAVVGVRAEAHMAGADGDEVELFPRADRGSVGDQRRGAARLRGDVPAVDGRAQAGQPSLLDRGDATGEWPQKAIGYGAAFFFGRRPMKAVFDYAQLRSISAHIKAKKKPGRFWLPNYRRRYLHVLQHPELAVRVRFARIKRLISIGPLLSRSA